MSVTRHAAAIFGAGLLAASMLACSADEPAPTEDDAVAETDETTPDMAPAESQLTISLDEWRERAANAAFIPRNEQCATFFSNEVTQEIADFIGDELYNVEDSRDSDAGGYSCFYSAKHDSGRGQGQFLFVDTVPDASACDGTETGAEALELREPREGSVSYTLDVEVCSDAGTQFTLRFTGADGHPSEQFLFDEEYLTGFAETMLDNESEIVEKIPEAYAAFNEQM